MIPRRHLGIIAVVAALSLGSYLLFSYFTYRIGFPLDDAWIHQTYARNLAESGEWSFVPGQPSAGSTAPLWSAFLAVGHAVGLGPYIWTYLLGWLGLVGLAVVGYISIGVFAPDKKRWGIWAAILLALEWHMVWAAGSGMETLPYTVLVTLILVWIAGEWGHWFWLGALIGLCAWLRPDGITLVAPAGLAILLPRGEPYQAWGLRARAFAFAGVGFLMFFLPYLIFNQILAGDWWPNTFFAKQAEYASERADSIGKRLAEQVVLPFVGVGAVLIPGFLITIYRAWRERNWGVLSGMMWWMGYVGLYAWRLPVTYQHGRYLMPVMPWIVIAGLAGMAKWVLPSSRQMWKRMLSRTWVLVVGLVSIVFFWSGANAYRYDVAFIESEMVETARWVAMNTEVNALIAAHDIGALGYFGKREILDLAGLVSPEVIPFIRDEHRLAEHLDANGAAYFVTLETWYPIMEQEVVEVFRTHGVFAPQIGGKNMVVYAWEVP